METSEEKAKREAEEKAKREAEERAKREAEKKAIREKREKAKREAEEKAEREKKEMKKKAQEGKNTVFFEDDVIRVDILSERDRNHDYDPGHIIYYNNTTFTFFNKQTNAKVSFQDNKTSGYSRPFSLYGGAGEFKPIPKERVCLCTRDGVTTNISDNIKYINVMDSLIAEYVAPYYLDKINEESGNYIVQGGKEIKEQVDSEKRQLKEQERQLKEQERIEKEIAETRKITNQKQFEWLKENFKKGR